MDHTRFRGVRSSRTRRHSKHAGLASKSRRDQRGAVAITVAVLLTILLGFGALAIDVGYLLSCATSFRMPPTLQRWLVRHASIRERNAATRSRRLPIGPRLRRRRYRAFR